MRGGALVTPLYGRWYITVHAVRRYARYVFGWQGEKGDTLPDDLRRRALEALIEQSLTAHLVEQRPATDKERPAELWRGARPLRLRYIVTPARGPGMLPVLVTILPRTEDRPEVLAAGPR